MAITTKKVLKWIWSEFKREMVIQKPGPEYYAERRHYESTRCRATGTPFWAKLLAVIIVAPFVLIFLLPMLMFIFI